MAQPAPMRQRAPILERLADDWRWGRSTASGPISAVSAIEALGWMPGSTGGGGMQPAHGPRECRARLGRANHRAPAGVRKAGGHDQAARGRGLRLFGGLAAADERQVARRRRSRSEPLRASSFSPSPSKVAPNHSASSRTRIGLQAIIQIYGHRPLGGDRPHRAHRSRGLYRPADGGRRILRHRAATSRSAPSAGWSPTSI